MHCYSGSAAQTWVSQILCWGGRAMFVLQTLYYSAFLPSSPLNSIVATLDEITEGKKSVVYSVRSEMSWHEYLCYNCYLVWSRSRGTFWEKKITQITIIYNGDSNQITITKNHDSQSNDRRSSIPCIYVYLFKQDVLPFSPVVRGLSHSKKKENYFQRSL